MDFPLELKQNVTLDYGFLQKEGEEEKDEKQGKEAEKEEGTREIRRSLTQEKAPPYESHHATVMVCSFLQNSNFRVPGVFIFPTWVVYWVTDRMD